MFSKGSTILRVSRQTNDKLLVYSDEREVSNGSQSQARKGDVRLTVFIVLEAF